MPSIGAPQLQHKILRAHVSTGVAMREQRTYVAPFFWIAGTGAIDTGASRSIDILDGVSGG